MSDIDEALSMTEEEFLAKTIEVEKIIDGLPGDAAAKVLGCAMCEVFRATADSYEDAMDLLEIVNQATRTTLKGRFSKGAEVSSITDLEGNPISAEDASEMHEKLSSGDNFSMILDEGVEEKMKDLGLTREDLRVALLGAAKKSLS